MKKILIIEDDKDYCDILTKELEKDKFIVSHASDGQSALNQLKKYVFDLIVLDLVLPNMDGMKFFQNYNKIQSRNIPIVILSNILLSDIKKISKKPNVKDYIIKSTTNLFEVTRKIKEYSASSPKE